MLHYFSFSGSFQLDPTEPAALHYTYSNFINIRYLAVNPVRHMRYTYSKLACIFWPHPVGGGLCLVLWGHGHYHRPTCSTRPSQGSLREDQSSMVNTELSIPDPVTTFWSSRSSSYPPMLFSHIWNLKNKNLIINQNKRIRQLSAIFIAHKKKNNSQTFVKGTTVQIPQA